MGFPEIAWNSWGPISLGEFSVVRGEIISPPQHMECWPLKICDISCCFPLGKSFLVAFPGRINSSQTAPTKALIRGLARNEQYSTLPETNRVWLEDYFPFEKVYFHGALFVLGRVSVYIFIPVKLNLEPERCFLDRWKNNMLSIWCRSDH